MLCSPLDKIFIIVNNIVVGREPLSFRRVKDSASAPYGFNKFNATMSISIANSSIINLSTIVFALLSVQMLR